MAGRSAWANGQVRCRPASRHSMNRRVVIAVLAVILLAAGIAAAFFWRSLYQVAAAPGDANEVQEFVVEPGTSLRAVLRNLEQRGLVTDARRLEIFLRCCQSGTNINGDGIKAGHYRIAPGQTPLDILRQLVEGRVVLEQLTIVEGWRFADMRALIEKHESIVNTLAGKPESEIMQALGRPGSRRRRSFRGGHLLVLTGHHRSHAVSHGVRSAAATAHRRLGKPAGRPAAEDSRRGAHARLHRREGNGAGQRAGAHRRACSSTGCARACCCRRIPPSSTEWATVTTATCVAATCDATRPTTPTRARACRRHPSRFPAATPSLRR